MPPATLLQSPRNRLTTSGDQSRSSRRLIFSSSSHARFIEVIPTGGNATDRRTGDPKAIEQRPQPARFREIIGVHHQIPLNIILERGDAIIHVQVFPLIPSGGPYLKRHGPSPDCPGDFDRSIGRRIICQNDPVDFFQRVTLRHQAFQSFSDIGLALVGWDDDDHLRSRHVTSVFSSVECIHAAASLSAQDPTTSSNTRESVTVMSQAG